MADVLCMQSGQSPPRVPAFADHKKIECPECGQRVEVFLRRMDWLGPRDLKFADHDKPEEAAPMTTATTQAIEDIHNEVKDLVGSQLYRHQGSPGEIAVAACQRYRERMEAKGVRFVDDSLIAELIGVADMLRMDVVKVEPTDF